MCTEILSLLTEVLPSSREPRYGELSAVQEADLRVGLPTQPRDDDKGFRLNYSGTRLSRGAEQ
jgi:hypothetical protein